MVRTSPGMLYCGMPEFEIRAGIRLAGATSDVHIMDVRSGKWEQIIPQGEPPSPRAAHAAAAVGSMVVIQVWQLSHTESLHSQNKPFLP